MDERLFLFKNLRNRRGFTLIELLVVIAIIGILATIAVPLFLGQRTKAIRSEALSNLEALRLLEEQRYAEYGEYSSGAGTCSGYATADTDAVKALIPGFKPGLSDGLYYSYCIIANKTIADADLDPCFTAKAFGKTGSPVEGQELKVDCNNEKDF